MLALATDLACYTLPVSRFFSPPRTVQVQVSPAGTPARLFWRGHREAVSVSNSWHVDSDWWRQGAEVARTYYKLRTYSGTVCVVYHDEAAGGWWLERILD